MTFSNPNLFPELRIQNSDNPGSIWQPREAPASMRDNIATDPSGFMRAVTRDGQVVGTETGKAMRASSASANEALNAAAGVPYDYALDPVNRCQIRPSELKDDSILFFHGRGEVTLAQARALGWYSPTSAQPQSTNEARHEPFKEGQEQPKEETHSDLQFDLLADETIDRDYSALVDNTSGIEQAQAIEQIVETGKIDQRTLGTLASQLRCEPEQLAARVAPIMAAFREQAIATLSEGGLDGEAVAEWAQQNRPDVLKRAMHQQATMRQTRGYAELRQGYLESLGEHSPRVALAADLGPGITQFMHPTKGVMVRVPGYGDGMTWKAAMKAFGLK